MKYKLITIIVFILFIIFPILEYVYPILKVEPVDEKRQKAELSSNIYNDLYSKTNTYEKIEKYYNDYFPLRDFFLRLNGQFEYSIFKRSKETIIGEAGWLTDKKLSTEQLASLDKLSDEDIQQAIIRFKKLQEYCNKNGIYFMTVIIPVKPTIYSDKFPKKYMKRETPIMLERFQNALKSNDIPYVDILSIYKQISSSEELYFKTDMHFNSVGSFYAAKAIINHLSQHFMEKDLWDTEIEKGIHENFVGNESSSLPLFYTLGEDTPIISAKKTYFSEFMFKENKKVKEYEGYKSDNQRKDMLPPMMMFGNSFMLRYPSIGFMDYFPLSYRVLDYEYFKNVLDYIEPKNKIFILHLYETQLLFHIIKPIYTYWDKRIDDLELPKEFVYKQEEKN